MWRRLVPVHVHSCHSLSRASNRGSRTAGTAQLRFDSHYILSFFKNIYMFCWKKMHRAYRPQLVFWVPFGLLFAVVKSIGAIDWASSTKHMTAAVTQTVRMAVVTYATRRWCQSTTTGQSFFQPGLDDIRLHKGWQKGACNAILGVFSSHKISKFYIISITSPITSKH